MKPNKNRLRTRLAKYVTKRREKETPGFLGDLSGVVKADSNSNVYVTLITGEVLTVRNTRVPNILRLPVIVGREEETGALQVLRSRKAHLTSPFIDLPEHADKNHTWPGVDTVWIRGEQFYPGNVIPTTGMLVQFFGFIYYLDGFHVIDNQIIDLTSYIPVSGANYILCEVDDVGVLYFRAGATKASRELLVFEDIPDVVADRKPLFASKMYVGQTRIIKAFLDSDIVDLRFAGIASGGISGSVAWTGITGIPAEFPPDTDVTDLLYPRKWLSTIDPTVNDDVSTGYKKLDLWLNTTSGDVFICTDNADGVAVWLAVGAGSGGGGSSDVIFNIDGALEVIADATNSFLVTKDMTVDSWYIYLMDQGTSGSTIVDVNLNGVTIFTTQANRPTLLFSDVNGWAVSGAPDFISFVEGDIISIDIDEVAPGAGRLGVVGLVSSSGSGSSLLVTDGSVSVEPTVSITFDGAEVVDDGGGAVTVIVPPSVPQEIVWWPALQPSANVNWNNLTNASIGQIYLLSSGAQNDEIEWDVYFDGGTYTLSFLTINDNNRGKYHLFVDDAEISSYDAYGSAVFTIFTFSSVTLAVGTRNIKLKMSDKNGSSSGYYGVLFDAWAKRTGA